MLLIKYLTTLGLSLMQYTGVSVAEPVNTQLERAFEQTRMERAHADVTRPVARNIISDIRPVRIRSGIKSTSRQQSRSSGTSLSTLKFNNQSGANLKQCVARLNNTGGGWCEIRKPGKHPSISSVWPPNLSKRTRMRVGPASVLGAWNGAAFDHQKNLMYFMGGGHADYGGNEVYEFDLEEGKWARLTDPSTLEYLYQSADPTGTRGAGLCWVPDMRVVPGSVHVYDGIQFSKKTRTIFLAMGGAANGSCFLDDDGKYKNDPRIIFGRDRGIGIYEFNPSRDETRNNLAPLTWRRLPTKFGFTYPRSLEFPDGRLMFGSKTTMHFFDPRKASIGKRLWQAGDWGVGLAEFHPSGLIMLLHGHMLLLRQISNGSVRKIPAAVPHGKSLAVRNDGLVFSWDGKSKILALDPTQLRPQWTIYDWSNTGPQFGAVDRVYSKWQYIRGHDVFVGISYHNSGVWIYRHPVNIRGEKLPHAGQ